MVINIDKLKDCDYEYVLNDIKEVKMTCNNKILKVIIEAVLLSKEEIEKTTEIVVEPGAEFIKTSIGFSNRSVSIEDIKIIKNVCGDNLLIKATGGKNLNYWLNCLVLKIVTTIY